MAWLREWIYFLDMLLADETWLASCNFGSPHQKEFRILGCNIEIERMNFPCTRDHSHVPIAGSFTKPSATYTDDLARLFASEIARAVWIKLAAKKGRDFSSDGLESLISNDVSESFQWKTLSSWRWRRNPHINIKEAAAFGRLAYHLAVSSPKSRFVAGLDSHVAISAIVKGRSPSYGLRPSIRRIGATLTVGCLYPALHFFPTRLNKSDHPTRDVPIPSPSSRSILKGLNLSEALDLAVVSNLRRFAANWARLTLLLLGSSPPWFSSKCSWRFAHYAYDAYPFSWRSEAARKRRYDDLEFDATLGFPGEGPLPLITGCNLCVLTASVICSLYVLAASVVCSLQVLWGRKWPMFLPHKTCCPLTSSASWFPLLICSLCVLAASVVCSLQVLWGRKWPLFLPHKTSLSSSVGFRFAVPKLLSLWIFCGLGFGSGGLFPCSVLPVSVLGVFVCLSNCPLVGRRCFACWSFVNGLSPPLVSAAPDVRSHGSLFPRDGGDRKRKQQRAGMVLEEGRPVLAQTRASREKLLQAFDDWLRTQGTDLDTLLDPKGLDIESINIFLERYGRAMYHAGRPYGHYSEVVNAVGAKRPSLKRMLQGAWTLAFTWLREEPPVHHVALPWQVLTALIVVAFTWGWNRVAGVIALSWGGLTRIGEVLKAYRKHLVLPKDLGYTIQYALLQIEEPKTRFRAARHQVARLDHPQLLQVIQLSFQDLKQHERLWSFSPQTLRNRFQRLLAAVKLDQLPAGLSKGLDLGSLRAGGASWMMLVTEDSEMVRRRGRWLSSKIMEIYVQEVSAIQFLHQLPDTTRRLVLTGTDLFPKILQQLLQWHASGTPESAWKYLLV